MGILQNHSKTCILLKRRLRKIAGVGVGIIKPRSATKRRVFRITKNGHRAKPINKEVLLGTNLELLSTNLVLLSTNKVLLSTNFGLLGTNLVLLTTNLVLTRYY